MIKILAASLVGAVLCVLWSLISWMSLQWHATALYDFHDEKAVSTVLKANVEDKLKIHGDQSGVFILPADALSQTSGSTHEEAPVPASSSTAKPPPDTSMFAFVVVRPGPHRMNLWLNMAWLFGRSVVACFLISMLLSWTLRLDYLQRVLFCAMAGLFAALVADVPLMIWFEMPLRYTLINFADHLCEWSLAGVPIAAFVEGREIWEKIR
jgi:hypothetical protein